MGHCQCTSVPCMWPVLLSYITVKCLASWELQMNGDGNRDVVYFAWFLGVVADPPPVTELCCDLKRRVPCQLKNRNLDKDPYTCRQLGCCYDGSRRRRRRRRRRGYGRGRRRTGKYGYRRPGYGFGHGNSYGYGDRKNQPRCFKTRRSKDC